MRPDSKRVRASQVRVGDDLLDFGVDVVRLVRRADFWFWSPYVITTTTGRDLVVWPWTTVRVGRRPKSAGPDAVRTRTRPQIVCLCGSTRFMAEMAEANLELTAAGYIVVAPGCDLKRPHPLWDTGVKLQALKLQLDALHYAKIDLADEVVIVTGQDRYVGDSTRAEIAYAEQLGKPVRWWSR